MRKRRVETGGGKRKRGTTETDDDTGPIQCGGTEVNVKTVWC